MFIFGIKSGRKQKKLHTDEKYRYEIKEILEMEMKISEVLNYYLVVFHPYRALSQKVCLRPVGCLKMLWDE
ncbi:Cyclin C [Artemisia annua]|uniref:Cyclin C n=1 Tax=Artemisia annua TaxID=35608 RepID=A0A2U1MWV9_ARTAN|nr:Cyclin C [Artemisia annua]